MTIIKSMDILLNIKILKEYDNFIQKSYYFICHIAKKGTVNLELYEKEEKYEAQFVGIKKLLKRIKCT